MTEHPAAPTTPEEWLRRLIGPSEPDGLGDENQHWRNHPEWPDDEGMLLGCTVGDLRQIAALIEAEARSTPAEALPSEAEFWKAAGEWQKAGSGMTSEQETGAAMVWSWLDSHGRSTPTEALDEDDDGPVGPVRITSANCFAGDHDECAGMVEQDAPELGITDCLCPHHFPARSTPAEALPSVGMLAEAIHSTYSIGCNSHALEECPYQRSKRTPVDFEEWAGRVHDWLSRLSPHNREAGER